MLASGPASSPRTLTVTSQADRPRGPPGSAPRAVRRATNTATAVATSSPAATMLSLVRDMAVLVNGRHRVTYGSAQCPLREDAITVPREEGEPLGRSAI